MNQEEVKVQETIASVEEPHGAAAEAQREVPVDWTNVHSVTSRLNDSASKEEISEWIRQHLLALAAKHRVEAYQILFLVDEADSISQWHSDRIYRAASTNEGSKDILLVIQSRGGSVEPAYLISKTCKRLSKDRFVVGVPRKAKSAATLVALGADEIHMGLMSELGPIDPQIAGLPALGMQNALSLLADLSCQFPGASEMLGKYLSDKMDLNILGYFSRVTESAVQYAERLLEGKPLPVGQQARQLGDHFVNHYKDHNFVIDADEASKLLGPAIVRQGTSEYRFCNEVYESLDFLEFMVQILTGYKFDLVGSIHAGPRLFKPKKPT